MGLPKDITNLSEAFSFLPGVGPKLSNRLALYTAIKGRKNVKLLAESIINVLQNIRSCDICGNITDQSVCEICTDEKRDRTKIVVVEDSLDLYNIESSGNFNGLYHVLGGLISPVNGIGPDELNIHSLVERANENINEMIFALNPNIEGDSTTIYIKNLIEDRKSGIEYTQLAKGIPVGSDIEYISQQTIADSISSRIKI